MRKKKHPQRHHPPWQHKEHGEGWEDGPPLPPWIRGKKARDERHPSGERLFFRFAFVFGLFVLLGCGVLAALGAGVMLLIPQLPIPQPGPSPEPHFPQFILPLVGAAIVLGLAFRWAGSLAAKHFTSPLSETMKATDALASGNLSVRVPVEGSSDFRHFARSFNRMAQALETADRQRRELLADVAHELRTPLTIIQGNLEGLRDGVYEATPEHLDLVLDETHRLGRLVDDLRLLTLAEAGQLPLDLQTLDVSQLLADVRDAFACQTDEAGIALIDNKRGVVSC